MAGAGHNYFFGAHEQQVFHGVGHARHVVVIAKTADVDVDRGAGFVGVGVMDQQGFELVGQSNDPIGAVIEGGGLELVGNPLQRSRGHDGESTRRWTGG